MLKVIPEAETLGARPGCKKKKKKKKARLSTIFTSLITYFSFINFCVKYFFNYISFPACENLRVIGVLN